MAQDNVQCCPTQPCDMNSGGSTPTYSNNKIGGLKQGQILVKQTYWDYDDFMNPSIRYPPKKCYYKVMSKDEFCKRQEICKDLEQKRPCILKRIGDNNTEFQKHVAFGRAAACIENIPSDDDDEENRFPPCEVNVDRGEPPLFMNASPPQGQRSSQFAPLPQPQTTEPCSAAQFQQPQRCQQQNSPASRYKSPSPCRTLSSTPGQMPQYQQPCSMGQTTNPMPPPLPQLMNPQGVKQRRSDAVNNRSPSSSLPPPPPQPPMQNFPNERCQQQQRQSTPQSRSLPSRCKSPAFPNEGASGGSCGNNLQKQNSFHNLNTNAGIGPQYPRPSQSGYPGPRSPPCQGSMPMSNGGGGGGGVGTCGNNLQRPCSTQNVSGPQYPPASSPPRDPSPVRLSTRLPNQVQPRRSVPPPPMDSSRVVNQTTHNALSDTPSSGSSRPCSALSTGSSGNNSDLPAFPLRNKPQCNVSQVAQDSTMGQGFTYNATQSTAVNGPICQNQQQFQNQLPQQNRCDTKSPNRNQTRQTSPCRQPSPNRIMSNIQTTEQKSFSVAGPSRNLSFSANQGQQCNQSSQASQFQSCGQPQSPVQLRNPPQLPSMPLPPSPPLPPPPPQNLLPQGTNVPPAPTCSCPAPNLSRQPTRSQSQQQQQQIQLPDICRKPAPPRNQSPCRMGSQVRNSSPCRAPPSTNEGFRSPLQPNNNQSYGGPPPCYQQTCMQSQNAEGDRVEDLPWNTPNQLQPEPCQGGQSAWSPSQLPSNQCGGQTTSWNQSSFPSPPSSDCGDEEGTLCAQNSTPQPQQQSISVPNQQTSGCPANLDFNSNCTTGQQSNFDQLSQYTPLPYDGTIGAGGQSYATEDDCQCEDQSQSCTGYPTGDEDCGCTSDVTDDFCQNQNSCFNDPEDCVTMDDCCGTASGDETDDYCDDGDVCTCDDNKPNNFECRQEVQPENNLSSGIPDCANNKVQIIIQIPQQFANPSTPCQPPPPQQQPTCNLQSPQPPPKSISNQSQSMQLQAQTCPLNQQSIRSPSKPCQQQPAQCQNLQSQPTSGQPQQCIPPSLNQPYPSQTQPCSSYQPQQQSCQQPPQLSPTQCQSLRTPSQSNQPTSQPCQTTPLSFQPPLRPTQLPEQTCQIQAQPCAPPVPSFPMATLPNQQSNKIFPTQLQSYLQQPQLGQQLLQTNQACQSPMNFSMPPRVPMQPQPSPTPFSTYQAENFNGSLPYMEGPRTLTSYRFPIDSYQPVNHPGLDTNGSQQIPRIPSMCQNFFTPQDYSMNCNNAGLDYSGQTFSNNNPEYTAGSPQINAGYQDCGGDRFQNNTAYYPPADNSCAVQQLQSCNGCGGSLNQSPQNQCTHDCSNNNNNNNNMNNNFKTCGDFNNALRW